MKPPASAPAQELDLRARYRAAPVTAIVDTLAPEFRGVDWREIRDSTVRDRVDSKYIVPAALVPELLDRAADSYDAVEVEGVRLATYTTRYFDTADYRLYHAHHSGRTPRYKVRIREYATTGDRFLEVKRKRAAGGSTQKERVRLEHGEPDPLRRLLFDDFLGVRQVVDITCLEPALTTRYQRLTLVSGDMRERVTVDLVLTCRQEDRARAFPSVAIVEVKQTVRARTPIMEALSALNLHRQSISKYCVGIAGLEPTVKANLFRPVFRRLDEYAEVEPVRRVGPHLTPASTNGIE